jgi:hypothetical protein
MSKVRRYAISFYSQTASYYQTWPSKGRGFVTPRFRGTKTRERTYSPGVLGPSLTHMMNHGT